MKWFSVIIATILSLFGMKTNLSSSVIPTPPPKISVTITVSPEQTIAPLHTTTVAITPNPSVCMPTTNIQEADNEYIRLLCLVPDQNDWRAGGEALNVIRRKYFCNQSVNIVGNLLLDHHALLQKDPSKAQEKQELKNVEHKYCTDGRQVLPF